MPLVDVVLPPPAAQPLSPRVRALIHEAGARLQDFCDRNHAPGFVASDFDRVGRSLDAVSRSHLATGDRFCEWGSGLGVVTMLADGLGFQACGIEINAELVSRGIELADDLGFDVEFACGTFVPPGGEDLTDVRQDFGWLAAGGACGHDALGVEPSDFGLIFAYPWPGEEAVIDALFERYAADAALLLTYHGYEDMRLQRKVVREPGADLF